jgi:SAM-dependent methyltransferase
VLDLRPVEGHQQASLHARPLDAEAGEEAANYGEGFAAVYGSSRYALFSQRMARLALCAIAEHGAPGKRLLDLACGAGAGSVVLAKAGYVVTGIDRSEVMIRHARQRVAQQGATLALGTQDIRSFELPHQVDVVTCLFDALNYVLEEAQLRRVFRGVARVLSPGGLFVFDMNTERRLATDWGTRDCVFTNRSHVFEVNQSRFDADSGINTTSTTVFVEQSDGLFRRYHEVHRERAYPLATLTRLLHETGLTVVSVHGIGSPHGLKHNLLPFTEDAPRVFITARPMP